MSVKSVLLALFWRAAARSDRSSTNSPTQCTPETHRLHAHTQTRVEKTNVDIGERDKYIRGTVL